MNKAELISKKQIKLGLGKKDAKSTRSASTTLRPV